MAGKKIKHTKNELKAQKEALARYERFLPMLQLKKQQLQAEIQAVDTLIAGKDTEERRVRSGLESWVALFSAPLDIEDLVQLEAIDTDVGNIAGLSIPVLKDVHLRASEPDLFATPTWLDDAVKVLRQLIRLRVERETLQEQRRLIDEELRTTSQRVNLFEKVKIPECRENIRVVKIFLGDEQTAGVVRGKIAKALTLSRAAQGARTTHGAPLEKQS